MNDDFFDYGPQHRILAHAVSSTGSLFAPMLRDFMRDCGKAPIVVLPSMPAKEASDCRRWIREAGGTPLMVDELGAGAEFLDDLPLPRTLKTWLGFAVSHDLLPRVSDESVFEIIALTARGAIETITLCYDTETRELCIRGRHTTAFTLTPQEAGLTESDQEDNIVDQIDHRHGAGLLRHGQQAGEATARGLARAAGLIAGNEWARDAWLGDLDCGPVGRGTPYPTWRKVIYAAGLLVATAPVMRFRRLSAQIPDLAIRLFDRWLFSNAAGCTVGAALAWLGVQSFQSAAAAGSTKAGITATATTLGIVGPPMAWTIGWLRRRRRPRRPRAPRR
ncbi:hypothetical protein [Catenulispora sp. GAS73]|uniref:hypothetical protein n=1 Tax=Catenulispora sp. GAS73 TaxID=3156269 RepID=UPI00351386EB